jgi:archaeosine synthase beta-subunit
MPDGVARATDREILAARGPKRPVDPARPQGFFVEPERTASGEVVEVATVLLTNRECPFRCLMCDLWTGTTDRTVPAGAIPAQIDLALASLPPARRIKLYNAGNFFDPRAIPPADHGEIARQVRGFDAVVVENHPRLTDDRCVRFRDRAGVALEVALGLETIHPDVLPALNKQMTLDDFARAVDRLLEEEIEVRAFVLIRPPYLDDDEGATWAVRSAEWAFSLGVGCVALIPTRTDGGLLDRLELEGRAGPPSLAALERSLAEGIALGRGRAFLDLWDFERFAPCPACQAARRERLHWMNLEQRVAPPVACERCG